jgi:hypothetical protein
LGLYVEFVLSPPRSTSICAGNDDVNILSTKKIKTIQKRGNFNFEQPHI